MRYSEVKQFLSFSQEDQHAMRERLNNAQNGMLQRWFTWNEMDKNPFWCCLAYDDQGHPVGLGSLRLGDLYTRTFDGHNKVYWASAFTEPQHRGKGIARELLKKVGDHFSNVNGNKRAMVRFMDRIASKMDSFKGPKVQLLSKETVKHE